MKENMTRFHIAFTTVKYKTKHIISCQFFDKGVLSSGMNRGSIYHVQKCVSEEGGEGIREDKVFNGLSG